MCNINLIWGEIDPKTLYRLMDIISYGSYLWNSDGEGATIFKDKQELTTIKSKNKILYWDLKNNFECDLIISHQRKATSGGIDPENTQPIKTENWIIFHNGVFANLGDTKGTPKGKSDTLYFAEYLESLKNEEYPQKPEVWIKTAIEKWGDGSYSLILYYIPTRRFFYVKNATTQFYYLCNDKINIGATEKQNLIYIAKTLRIKEAIKRPHPYVIYEITKGEWIPTKTEITPTYTPTFKKGWNYGGDYYREGLNRYDYGYYRYYY